MKIPDIFHRYDLKKGIFFVLLGWLSFSTMYAISKYIEKQTTIPTMLFFRNILGLLFVLPWVFRYWPSSLKIKRIKVVILRSIMGILNLFFIFLAIKYISLVNTTLLNNSAPFFVPLIVWLWFRKPLPWKIFPAVIIGFIGIALILQPDTRIFNLGALYALLSGISLAITLITLRMTTQSEKLYSMLLYFFAIGAILTIPFAIFSWKVDSFLTLMWLLSLGFFSAMGQILLFMGLKYGKAHQLAPFTYSTVIFSGIYEWLIWDIVPPSIAYLGMILIIASGIWIVWITPKKIE